MSPMTRAKQGTCPSRCRRNLIHFKLLGIDTQIRNGYLLLASVATGTHLITARATAVLCTTKKSEVGFTHSSYGRWQKLVDASAASDATLLLQLLGATDSKSTESLEHWRRLRKELESLCADRKKSNSVISYPLAKRRQDRWRTD